MATKKAEIEFTPTQHYKTDKKGNYILDKNNCKIKIDLYKGTKFKEMTDFLKENATEEQKKEFKKACYTKKVYDEVIGVKGGKSRKFTGETVECEDINVLYAKEWFFTQFAPQYLPQPKAKETKPTLKDLLAEL